jgi:hypothetical protein
MSPTLFMSPTLQGSPAADGCLMKFGSLPPARDSRYPTAAEGDAVKTPLAAYQVFNTH